MLSEAFPYGGNDLAPFCMARIPERSLWNDGLNVIVGGASNSGKSTFAQLLADNFHMSRIPLDPIVAGMAKHFPGAGINHWSATLPEDIGPFVATLCSKLQGSYEGTKFVVDGGCVSPALASELDPGQWRMLFFGYPDTDLDFLVRRVTSGPRCWLNEMNEDEIRRFFGVQVEISKRLEAECASSGALFVNTGDDDFSAIRRILALQESDWQDYRMAPAAR